VTEIGSRAFYYCSSLQSVVLPSTLTIISDASFSYNDYYDIARGVFADCSSLQSVVIPPGVTRIGNQAFDGCRSLQSVVIPAGVTRIGSAAFSDCSSLQSVVIPQGVTQIGDGAYYGCRSLQSVVIPQGVTQIGERAFYGCRSLQSVVIPQGVTEIGESAFDGCSSLQSMVIPQGVTEIGDWAFRGCSSLQSVVIPQGVTEIGSRAFYYCRSLQSVVIPQGVTTIGGGAFSGCSSLQSVEIPGGVDIDWLMFSETPFLDQLPGELQIWDHQVLRYRGTESNVVIPADVTRIGSSTFSGCSSLQSVVIPDSVTVIGSSAFWYCSSLQSVVIPDSVTVIGSSAFWYCSSLQSVVIPPGVTEIGDEAFDLCQRVTDPFSQKVVIQLPPGVQTVGHNFARGCVAEVTLWQGEGTTVGSDHGFSDVYLQIVDTAGMFLCRVYIPDEYVREPQDAGEETHYYPSAYGYWATRLLTGGARSISEYDTFFAGYPDHEEEPDQVLFDKARIALSRLRFPYELSEEYKLAYEQFLIQHARLTIQKLAKDNNLEMLTFLLENVTIPLQKYIDMVDWSAKAQRVEITAMLLEYRHRTWGDTVLRLSLDDLAVEADEDEDELESDDYNIPF
jgi:hypothetical protein